MSQSGVPLAAIGVALLVRGDGVVAAGFENCTAAPKEPPVTVQIGEGVAFAHRNALAVEVVVFHDGRAADFIEAVDVVGGDAAHDLLDARPGGTHVVIVEVALTWQLTAADRTELVSRIPR